MIALALPVVLSELGWVAQGVVDNIMVGRLGPVAIGAVALGNAVYYIPSLFGIGLLLGLDTLVSQAYGRRDYDACHRWMAQGVYLAFIITPPLMLLTAVASYEFTRFGVIPEVALLSSGYLRIMNWGTLPLLLYGGTRRYLRGAGEGDYADVCAGEPAELGRELAADLRQVWVSGAGRERVGNFDVRFASGNGSGNARVCVEV